jgi:hypothetical protein
MEHEITNSEIWSTKRTLTVIVAVSITIGVVSAVSRALLNSHIQDFSNPVVELLGATAVLGLFIALLALNTRLQIELDESEFAYQAMLENRQK